MLVVCRIPLGGKHSHSLPNMASSTILGEEVEVIHRWFSSYLTIKCIS